MSVHGGSVRGQKEALAELRLRADSSAHGGRAAAAATAAARLEEGNDSLVPDGPLSSQHHEQPDPEAWVRVDGLPRGNDNTVWQLPLHAGLAAYVRKWLGKGMKAEDVPTWETLLLSTIGSFAGILAICALSLVTDPHAALDEAVPSFGASAVLIYAGFDKTPLAQPRAFVGGQILSAAVGCAFRNVFGPRMFWLSAPLAMSLALLLMQLTRTTHPPGGATAFVAATMESTLPSHSFRFMGGIAIGSIVMLLVALIVDNLHHTRRYPNFWFGSRWKESWVP